MLYRARSVPGAFHPYRLPRGRHGLPESQVWENQRWRLLGACAEIIAGRGFGHLSVRSLTKEASVSKATFYRHFRDLNECAVATYEMAAANALGAALEGCGAAPDAGGSLPEGVGSVFDLLTREPVLAHVLTDGALLDVPGIYPVRAELASRLATLLAATADAGGTGRSERGWRLSLHRVRATIGFLSLRLGEAAPAAFSAATPELTQLLKA